MSLSQPLHSTSSIIKQEANITERAAQKCAALPVSMQTSLSVYLEILKLCVVWSSWERYHVSDITHTRNE